MDGPNASRATEGASLEPLEPRLLLSAVEDLPGLVGPADLLEATAGQVVYLDFDGAEGVLYDGPVKVEGINVPAFSAEWVGLQGQEGSLAAAVTRQVAEVVGLLGVKVTAEAPASGEFSTVYIGGSGAAFSAWGRFDGLAEKIDAGNLDPSDAALVFSDEIGSRLGRDGDYVSAVAAVTAHEIGHLLGLSHAGPPAGAPESPAELLAAVAHMTGPGDGGDPASEGPVHQYLTDQAWRFYDSQFPGSEMAGYLGDWTDYGSKHHRANGDNNDLVEGTFDEDVGLLFHGDIYPQNPFAQTFPYFRHFAAGGDGDEIYDGWSFYESAVTQALRYWQDYVIANYASAKATAYYYLGHVVHLLEDMTVPAHVHNDDHAIRDAYEYTMGEHYNYALWGVGEGARAGPVGPIGLPADLVEIFRATIDYTEEYDSNDADGDDEAGIPNVGRHRPDLVDRSGGLSGDGQTLGPADSNELTILADDLMPWAMEQVAGLLRLFYSQVDLTGPAVELYGLSAESGSPTPRTPNFVVSGWAADAESGASARVRTWRQDGSSWIEQTDWGPCRGGSVACEIAVDVPGIYRVQLIAENGAGAQAATAYGYVEVSLTPGDATGEGVVDGADYTVWADHYKQPGIWRQGDFNGDSFVDGADYTIWADSYAEAGPGASGKSTLAEAGALSDATVTFTSAHFSLELNQDRGEVVKLGYRTDPGDGWTYYEVSLFGRYLDSNGAAHDTLDSVPVISSATLGAHTLVKYEIRQGPLFWNFWFDLDDQSQQLQASRFVCSDSAALTLNGVGMVFEENAPYANDVDLDFTYTDVGGTHKGGYFDFQDGAAGLRVMFGNTSETSSAQSGAELAWWYRKEPTGWNRQIDYRRFTFVPYTVGQDLSEFEHYQKQYVFSHELTNPELAGAWVVRSTNRFGDVRDWFNEAEYDNGFLSSGSKAGFWRDDWSTGGVMCGLIDTYVATGDLFYLQRAIDIADYQIDRTTGRLRSRWGPNERWQENYAMGRIEALLEIYNFTGLEYYRQVAIDSTNWFLDTEVFLPSGCHEYGFYTDLSYGMEGLIRAVELDGGNLTRYNRIRDWYVCLDATSYDPGADLYIDSLNDPTRYWSRGNGWWIETFMGIMDVYRDDPTKAVLQTHFNECSNALIALQEGIWHVSLTEPGTVLESSGGTMIAAGLAEGFVKGQLGPEALASAMEAISYFTVHKLFEDGTITGTDRNGTLSSDPFPYTQEGYVKFARNLGIKEIVELAQRSSLYTDFDEGVLICDDAGGTVTDASGDVIGVDGRTIIKGYISDPEGRTLGLVGLAVRAIVLEGFQPGRPCAVTNRNLTDQTESRQVVMPDGSGRLSFQAVLAGSHEVRIAPLTEGDANGDGFVDGSDYTLWADHYKQPGQWGQGDFNLDGLVDGADYTLWADHFAGGDQGISGQAAPAEAAAPQAKGWRARPLLAAAPLAADLRGIPARADGRTVPAEAPSRHSPPALALESDHLPGASQAADGAERLARRATPALPLPDHQAVWNSGLADILAVQESLDLLALSAVF